MTLPAEITTGVVTVSLNTLVRDQASGSLVLGDVAGSVTFVATPKLFLFATAPKRLIMPQPVGPVAFSGDTLTQELARTDDAYLSPGAWTWVAYFTLQGGLTLDPVPFELTGDTLDLTDAAPLPASDGVPITRGVQGPPGGAMALVDNADGTATFSWTDESQVAHSTGVPTLDGSGKIDPGTLPALAVVSVFTVSSQAAMLALSAQQGDIAVRTDEGNKYILTAADPTTLANWVLLVTSAFPSSEISDATSIGRTILTAANAASVISTLGLGTAATVNTGTGSGNVPVLNTSGRLDIARLGSGTPNGTQYLRDDGTLVNPLPAPTWTTPTIANSTTPAGQQPVRYCKDVLGWVNVEGSFQLSTLLATGGTLWTFPAGMRPAASEGLIVTTGSSTSNSWALTVDTSGVVTNSQSGSIASAVTLRISGRFYVG